MCWFLFFPSLSPDDLAVQPELELLTGRLRGEHSLLTPQRCVLTSVMRCGSFRHSGHLQSADRRTEARWALLNVPTQWVLRTAL